MILPPALFFMGWLLPSPSTAPGPLLLPLLLLALTAVLSRRVSLPAAILGRSAVKRLLTSH